MKKFLYLFFCLTVFLILFYFSLLYFLPKIINSPNFVRKIEKIVLNKTNLKTQIKNLNISISKNLNAQIFADLIEVEDVLRLEKLKINSDIKTLKIKSAEINYLFLDSHKFKKAFDEQKTGLKNKKKNKKKSNKFILSKVFNVQILKADIVLYDVNIKFENIIFNSTFKSARYNLKAQKIPVEAVMRALLRFQKSKDPQKKFIENFKNYQGLMEFDLSYENKKLSGFIKAHNLHALSVLFDVPFYFKNPLFTIKDNILTSNAKGEIGGNCAYHNLKIINILSKERETFGSVSATLDEKLSKKYFPPDIKIVKSTDAVVKYHIKNKIPEVEYFLNLNKGSDVFYKTISLGLREENRKFYAKTLKRKDKMFLEKYFYSYSDLSKIVSGAGLFKRENKKFKPKFISIKTNGFTPLTLAGNFSGFVFGGEFSGDLIYDFENKKIIGRFEVVKTFFKDFYVESAKILSNEKEGFIKAHGKYKKEKFITFAKFQNNFKDKIIVDDMNLFLECFDAAQNKKKDKQKGDYAKNASTKAQKFEEFSNKVDNNDILIKNWQININLLKYNKIRLEKIKLAGKFEDSVFEFLMPEINYTKGELSAKGKYDFLHREADIFFYSRNIDSDLIARTFFDLKNQIKGIANAKLRLQTFDDLKKIKADADFELKNGELTKINSKISKSLNKTSIESNLESKFSSKTQENLSGADIKGSFEFDNFSSDSYVLKDIDLTSKQESFSMFLEGDYDILRENADIDIFGKYNVEAPKGIKVFFVPLNWILNFVFLKKEDKNNYLSQINKIPEFKKQNFNKKNKNKQKLFKINIDGNLNKDKIKLDFKGLK